MACFPLKALQTLLDMNSPVLNRVLTSGGESSALKGCVVLKEMVNVCQKHGSKVHIMAGAGVNADNVSEIISQTGVSEVHGSLRVLQSCKTKHMVANGTTMGASNSDEFNLKITSSNIVKAVLEKIGYGEIIE